ncbi:hypothetical protein LIP_0929 [Limnochorda pilosa]|uniref:Uncharacterized protein n=1 Tax=Limnochorda pilosa TaxID=1555112 RepID=A0A0K2SI31_LIMPI|nr:hypothetical protein LIP_0929 [Limnochorda pilosa]
MGTPDAKSQYGVARRHLDRVQTAWDQPTDRSDLSLYGFHCLEAAVMAAAAHVQFKVQRTHWQKGAAARDPHVKHGSPAPMPRSGSRGTVR